MTIWRGLTLVINDGAPIACFDAGYRWWGRGEMLGISIPIWIFAIVAILGYLVLHKTRWWRFEVNFALRLTTFFSLSLFGEEI